MDKTEVIDFFSDGRISISDKGRNAAGGWVLLNDGRVKIEASVLGMTTVITGKVDGNILRPEMGGKTAQYRKMPS